METKMRLSVNLAETDSQIRLAILNALSQDVTNTINRSVIEIRDSIQSLFKTSLKLEPAYAS